MAYPLNRLNRIVVAISTSTTGIFNRNRCDFMVLGDGQKQGAENFAVRSMPLALWPCGRILAIADP